jgi:ankyrin repeat protein
MTPANLACLLLVLSIGSLRAEVMAGAETLAKAARTGALLTEESLLQNGLDPDVRDGYGVTPLYYAVSFNQTKAVQVLLSHRADPNIQVLNRSSGFPATPLQSAAHMGNLRIASLLIGAGARVNAAGPTGRTALHFAALAMHLDVMRYLLEKGADINTRDAEGASPLDEAVWRGNLDVVAILLANGARLNEPEAKTGATPINEAAYRGNTRLVQYLLQFQPDLSIRDKRGYSPLENAARTGKEDTAVLLVEAEAKQQTPPSSWIRTMDVAIGKNESKLVQAVLDHGADPNTSAGKGTSPLEDAALRGYAPICGLLLDHGARVNEVNAGSGTTALYAAASFGKAAVVKLLLERGADANLCGQNHRTPYRAAVKNGFAGIAAELQHHGGSNTCSYEKLEF